MKNNIIALLTLFLLASCTLIPTDERIIEPPNFVTINTDPTIQAQYKAEWLALVSTINFNDNRYTGEADIFGAGPLNYNFWFVNGELYDYMDAWPSNNEMDYLLYKLVVNSFINGHTIVMEIPGDPSYPNPLDGTLYVIKISNNTIYRTYDVQGVEWDGKQVDIANLVPIGTKPK